MHEPLSSFVPSRDEFTMKLYLIDDPRDPLLAQLFREEIARHQKKYDYLRSRWEALFRTQEDRLKHFGHSLILEQAIERERQRLQWLVDTKRNMIQ